MKKFLSLIFIFLILSVLPNVVLGASLYGDEAANRPTLSINRVWPSEEGSIISIPMKLSNVPSNGLMSVETTIKYDREALEFISADAGSIIRNASTSFTANHINNEVTLVFMDEDLGNNLIKNDGVFATLTFKCIKSSSEPILIKELTMCDGDIKEVSSSAFPIQLIAPSKAVFDMSNPADLTVTLYKGETLKDIKAHSVSLQKDFDYTVSGNTVTIKKGYFQNIFSKFETTTDILTFNMASGTCGDLRISRSDKIVFDINNPTDVTVKLISGETLADIKAGSASLVKGTDYTVSGDTVKISRGYYQYIFGKWPKVTNVLTLITISGKTQSLTATATGTTLISPSRIVFDMNNPADVVVTTDSYFIGGVYAGSSRLVEGVDYTWSGKTIRISKNYYQYIFSKWPAVTNVLTFTLEHQGTVSLFATATAGTPLITPNKIVFDTNNPSDVLITIANDETLADIKAGSALLTKGTDYTVSGNTVKISNSYYQYIFGKWPAVTNILTFNMVSGKSSALTATATAGAPLITPSNVVFHFGSPSDAAITIANGEVLTDIKAGSVSLKKGTDYTVSGNTVMLNGYFRYIFSKWPAVTCNLTFIMASGKTATLTATAAKEIVVKDSTIAPNVITIPQGTVSAQSISLTLNGNTLSSITGGSYVLKSGTDYVLNGDKVTLKASYLSTLTSSKSLVFNFSKGTSSTLSVSVVIPDKSLSISLGSVTATSGSTVTVPVILKGIPSEGLAGIQVTAQFDSAYVSSAAYEAGPACTNPSKNLAVTISGNKIQILFIDDTVGDQLLLNDGVLVNLKLTLKKGIKGTTNLKIVDPATASNVDFKTYTPKLVDSVITIN